VDVVNSGTYNVNTTDTINSLSGSGRVALGLNQTLTTGDAGNYEISGVISATGSLTKVGSGTLTLSNTNTFTGDLTISAGTVTVSGTLHDDVDVINSGTYDVDSTDTINSLRGSGAVELDTGITLTTGDAGSDEISGIISGAGNLTKVGVGILTLSNTNTYSGITTINNGTISISADNGLGAAPDSADADHLTINGGTLNTSSTFSLATNRGITIGANDATIDVDGSTTLSYAGAITGAGDLTKTGDGTLNLTGSTDFSGSTTIGAGGLGLSDVLPSSTDLTVNGTLNLLSSFTVNTLSGSGNVNLSSYNLTISNGSSSDDTTFSGVIDSTTGRLIKNGDGTQTLSGTNTYSGTTINGGILKVSADANLGTAPLSTDADNIILGGGTLNTTASFTLNTNRGITLTGNSSVNVNSSTTLTYAGVIADNASTYDITKSGSGSLALSGTHTYDGDTTISAGTIVLTGALNTATDMIISSGATWDLQNSQTINSLNLDGTISNGAGSSSLTVTTTSDIGGNITTSGTQTYTGAVVISAAVTLTTTDNDVLFSSTINGTASNESLTISTGSGDVTFSSTIGASTAINTLTVTSSGTIYVAGNITTADSGTAGLYAEYFNDDNFAGNPSRFNSWSADSPLSSMVSYNGNTYISNSTMTTAFICRGGSCGSSYSWRVSGYFNPSSDGTYYFATASDDYSLVYIGDAGESISSFITNVQSYSSYNNSNISNDLIVNNGGDHPVVTRTGSKIVTAGNSYPIIMYFDENGGGDYFAFAYNTTGISSIDSNSEVQSNVANLTSEFTHNEGGSASDGTITFNGAVTLTGSSTMTGDTQFASTLTGGSNGLTVTGDLDLDGAASGLTSVSVSGTSDLDANITTSGSQTYTGAATLNADVILTTTDNNISFGSTINSLDTTYRDLSLVTGSGNVSVTGIIGADDKLDVLTVNNTGTVTLSAATTVNTLTLTHTGGTTIGGTLTATTINLTDTTDAADITFNGNVSATTLNTAAEGYNVIFNGTTSTITNLVTFSNSGSVTFGNGTGDTTTFTGGVTATAPSQVNLAGTIQTTNNTMSLGDAGTPIVLTANTILSGNTAGAITLGGTVNGGYSLTVNTTGNTTFTLAVGNTTALTTLTTNASGTTYINGGAITTSSTQTYNDAVVLGADTTLTTTDSNITFNSTVDSDSAGTKRNLTLTLGTGSATFSGIVGTTSLADITLNSNATFNAAVTATNLTIAASKTATVKDDVTIASTIALSGSSTLTVLNASTMTVAGTITDTGTGNTISVNDSNATNAAPDEVTFSGTVAADTLTIGSTTTAGKAKFTGSGGATIGAITITGGNHADEDSTATFNYALTSTSVTLDDNTGSAYLIFAENNSVTIAGTIDGAANNEGSLQVSGTLKTFSGAIGNTYRIDVLDIDTAASFSSSVATTTATIDGTINTAASLNVSSTTAINANVTTTGAQTYAGAATLNADVILTTTDNNISFGSTINSLNTTYRDLSLVTGSGNVSVTGIIGASNKLDVLTVNNTGTLTLSAATTVNTLTLTHTGGTTVGGTLTATTINLTDTTDAADITFNGNVSATTLNTAAEGYNVIFNGTTSSITNAVTFSNSGSVTFGNDSSDSVVSGGVSGGFIVTAPSQINLNGELQTANGNMILGDADTPIVLVGWASLNTSGSGTIIINGTVDGTHQFVISNTSSTTINSVVGGSTPLAAITTNTLGTTYINGGAITTTGASTYNDAVVLGANTTLTTTNNNVTFNSTVDSDSADTKRNLILTLGLGQSIFNDIVGNTSLANISLNSHAVFNAAVTANNLTIAASKTATVKDDVTIASNITLNNNSTLAVVNTAAITIAGTIVENGEGATNTSITVKFNTASTVPEKVTFSGTVTADTIYVGDTAAATYAGYAHFTGSGGVTVADATVASGNHVNEYSILKFDYAVTASNEITINDKNGTAFQAYLIFSGDNTVTIAGNIVTADDEGTLQVTGTGKTFTGSIGSSTYQLELINIDVATTFNGAVYTTDLEVDGAITSTNSLSVSEISTINANITTSGSQTYTGAVTLNADVILTTQIIISHLVQPLTV
jgi:autotransporter-associated beta strand protein